MLSGDEVIKLIDNLDKDEREKVLAHVLRKYITLELLNTLDQKQNKNLLKYRTLIVDKDSDPWLGEGNLWDDKD